MPCKFFLFLFHKRLSLPQKTFAAISRYVAIICSLCNRLAIFRFSKYGALQRSIALVCNESTQYDFILLWKACQRLFEARAANVWEFTQKPELNINN